MSILAATLIAVAAQPDPAAKIVERFRNRWRRDAELAMSVRAKLPSGETATGRLEWHRPSRLRFVVRTARDRGEFRQVGAESIEVNHTIRQYLTQGGLPGLVPPPGYASGLADAAFPYIMNAGDLHRIVEAELRFKLQSPVNVDGALCDVVRSASETVRVTAAIDAAGRLRRLQTWFRTPAGDFESQADFSAYSKPSPELAAMNLVPPLGYSPYFLPILYFPVAIGQKVDLGDLSADERRRLGQRGLVLICDATGAPDMAMRRWLRETGLEFVERGPQSRLGQRAATAGTPVLLLVDSAGLVERVWFGFSAAIASELGRDVRGALGG